MGPINVRGQKPSRQLVSEVNLSALSSHLLRGYVTTKVGHWTRDKNKKGRQISSKASTSALIASQPTLWPH